MDFSFEILIYKAENVKLKTLNLKTQWILIQSVITQVAVTILFLILLFLPISIALQFQTPYSRSSMVYFFCIISLHLLIETIVTFIFVLPYKRFIVLIAVTFWKKIFKQHQMESVQVNIIGKNNIYVPSARKGKVYSRI